MLLEYDELCFLTIKLLVKNHFHYDCIDGIETWGNFKVKISPGNQTRKIIETKTPFFGLSSYFLLGTT